MSYYVMSRLCLACFSTYIYIYKYMHSHNRKQAIPSEGWRASSSTKNRSVWLGMPSNSYSPCSFIAANLPHPTGSVSRSKHVTWSLARRCPMRVQFWSPCRKRKRKWLPKQSIQRQLHVSARGKSFEKCQKSQDAKSASGEIARANSGVNSPNVHMGLVTSDVDATWGRAGEPAERSSEKEIVPLGGAFRNCCSDSIPACIRTPNYALQRIV